MTITFRPGEEMDWIEAETFFIESYPAGRVCDHDGCDTVLSIYNPDPHCGAHRPEPDWSYGGRMHAPCEDCGEILQVKRSKPHHWCDACSRKRRRIEATKMGDATEKLCRACGETKPADAFGKDKRTPTGLHSRCKACERVRDAARRRAR